MNAQARMQTPADDFSQYQIDPVQRGGYSLHVSTGPFVADWHHHRKGQLLFADGGVIFLESRDQSLLIPAQHGAWIPSNCWHRVYSRSPRLVLRMVYFDPEADDPQSLNELSVFPLNNLAREMIFHTVNWSSKTEQPDQVEGAFFKTLKMMVAEWAGERSRLRLPVSHHPRLAPVLNFISQHLAADLSIEKMAACFAMSSRTLMRLFQSECGMGFSDYVRTARMLEAMSLLSQPGTNVTEAALAVGYESMSAFTTTFTQLVGVRPNEYMRRHQ